MFNLGTRVCVCGEHEADTPADRVEVKLLPQRGPRFAFGNGYKRSTRIFLAELENYVDGTPPGFKILDIGTGVGTLSIAAQKMNPDAEITAIEPLDVGQNLARRNFILNGVSGITLLQGWYPDDFLDRQFGPFDLVLANLDTLPPMAAAMNRHLAPTIITMPKTKDMLLIQKIASQRGYQILKQITDHGEYEFIVLGL